MTARAQRLADEVLLPAALAVDQADGVPESHFRALADAGFYGIATSLPDLADTLPIAEALASGCLTTSFVWIQHHSAVRAAPPELQAELERGEVRSGIALAGARAGQLKASKVDGGYLLDGQVPWVTGWGMIHVLQVAALDGDEIRFFLMDVVDVPSLRAERVNLVAAQASRTVILHFTRHFLPDERHTGVKSFAEWSRNEASGTALVGALALGVAARCGRMLGGAFGGEIEACRGLLLGPDVPEARAAASELAMRAAATLTVHIGSRAVLLDNHAQRLMREAAFLLVFGTRPLIKEALLRKLAREDGASV